jgi:hypothetical protein
MIAISRGENAALQIDRSSLSYSFDISLGFDR